MVIPPPSVVAVRLRRLFASASFIGCGDIQVQKATDAASDCQPGCLFAALPGSRHNGHDFIAEAIARGATSLLVERPDPSVTVPQCVVPNSRRAFAELCAALHGHPAQQLKLCGVTGTNGKTTTTWLFRSICQAARLRTGLSGTIEYHDGLNSQRASLTTPGPRALAEWMATLVRNGATHGTLELSSHALDQQRTAGVRLDAAILTNITQDHFDYHGSFAAYRASKLRIFKHLKSDGVAILNQDDPGSASCREEIPARVVTYGLDEPADVRARVLDESLSGTEFELQLGGRSLRVHSPLIGRHNVSNCLAAAAAAHAVGLPVDAIRQGIEDLHAVPGRMESVECGQPHSILVDYAHTDDALRRAVQTVRHLTAGQVICVFGAGGDRDRSKRALMGAAAGAADVVVVTSDNPRSEPPAEIIRDILRGLVGTTARVHVEEDRSLAIGWALSQAAPGDCVLIAGKGHETEQIVGAETIPFDDRLVARFEFRRLSSAAAIQPPHVPRWGGVVRVG